MKALFFTTIAVALWLNNVVQAQPVLSCLVTSSYENSSSAPKGDGGDDPEHNASATSGIALNLSTGGHFGAREFDNRENGPEFYVPATGHLTDHNTPGRFDDDENGDRGSHGLPTSGSNQFCLPANCCPIPEPSNYAVLLGLAAFGVVLRHRTRRERKSTVE